MVQLLGLYVLSSSFGLCNIELYMFLKLVSQQLELVFFFFPICLISLCMYIFCHHFSVIHVVRHVFEIIVQAELYKATLKSCFYFFASM